jgi:hypothetical protein
MRCPKCRLKVRSEVYEGVLIMYSKNGRYHSCGRDGKKIKKPKTKS